MNRSVSFRANLLVPRTVGVMEFRPEGNEETTTPTEEDTVRAELEAAMRANKGRLGDAFCGEGVEFSNLYNERWNIDTILAGKPGSASRSRSRGCKGRINRLLAENAFSPETVEHLERALVLLSENIASESSAVADETEAEETSRRYEQADLTGVYVYSLPTFLRVEQMTDPARYWFKVGMTETSSFRRVREQARQTGLPEDPVIYRVYQHPVKSPRELETDFHNVLIAAGHDRSEGRAAGTEWFQTNLDLLDALADALGCTTPHINEDS